MNGTYDAAHFNFAFSFNLRCYTQDWITGTKLSEQESLRAQGLDVLQLVVGPGRDCQPRHRCVV
jgi:hypothetical protein